MDSFAPDDPRSSHIAVIGMSGRFPGAPTVASLWQSLRDGVEGISTFSDEELRAAGVSAEDLADPLYVKAGGALAEVDQFDPEFFGFSQREAEITDPQQRLFLECSWEALEDAGYDGGSFSGPVGVYAGVSLSTYLFHLLARPETIRRMGRFRTILGNDKDYVSTWVSYKLNLRGPSLTVQTACSTSLVAVHLACQSLLNRECDMALAGGATVGARQRTGYLFQDGGITSPDGHCRAFDARAQGTVPGNGVGVVVLKRLEDALADGDTVRAVILGSAVNNDGSLKVGYTAPSIEGQARVISEALAVAGVDPSSIGYVEAHGTGTPLGDPIEVEALSQAFRAAGVRGQDVCALGSVKTNLGHLDAAAGVTGLIKTVLALEHGLIPPSLHLESPSPRIDFAQAGFRVSDRLTPWERRGGPRRAGVSSFGMGGTNAHVVLEEAPEPLAAHPAVRPSELLVLSARSGAALDRLARDLARHLRERPELALADIAHTLRAGRKAFPHRRAVVCRDLAEAVEALEAPPGHSGVVTGEAEDRRVVFLFPGQGAQQPEMAAELYRVEPVFKAEIDRCADLLRPHLGRDLRELLFPPAAAGERAAEDLQQTALAQPAIFAVEHSLARLWMSWGVVPEAMVGHSVGELTAACLAGVFSLADGLALAAERGRLMQELPRGSMLAVSLDEERARALLGDELSLAAVNGPSRCVISGPETAVAVLAERLETAGVGCRPLRTSHAFHSSMMEPAVAPFVQVIRRLALAEPRIPYVSNVTGTWITPEQATRPEAWGRHLREPVRFAAALAVLAERPDRILLEVGPGQGLTALARASQLPALPSLSHSRAGGEGDTAALLAAAGALWCSGVRLDWASFGAGERRRRVPLPTYPFERRRCWFEGPPTLEIPKTEREETSMPDVRAEPGAGRREAILALLGSIIHGLVGVEPEGVEVYKPFLEIGVDSLLMIQFSQEIRKETGVRISLAEMMEEMGTVAAVAERLDSELPAEFGRQSEAPASLPSVPPAAEPAPAVAPVPVGESPAGSLQRLFEQQLQVVSGLIEQQLQLLRQGTVISAPLSAMAPAPIREAPSVPAVPAVARPEVFVPFQPLEPGTAGGLNPFQKAHLDSLVTDYTRLTAESRRQADRYRRPFADNRNSVGFRLLWKDLAYPIVARRSAGSRFWDLDGNEYVDIAMGFGVYLFGHSPEFLMQALREQLDRGLQIGPQSELAGEVAASICDLTGVERVAFSNSGTEAVMVAMRLARAVTGRTKIALFAGSYHGTADGVLARGVGSGSALRAVPVAPGIPEGAIQDLVVLEYGDPGSLEVIRTLGPELAAVLVEPVQTRRPELQPGEFLRELRRLTAGSGTALIFDEVVTGFRCHPGGTQAWFDVKADIVTYGKVLASGMPIGVVAGKAEYLDAIDGGEWHFGDGSFPQANKTMFAGTFCKHPLAMAATGAVVQHLKAEGPGLQRRLNARTTELAGVLNSHFEAAGYPLQIVHFGSLFRFMPAGSGAGRFRDLFFYHLVKNGVYVWEGNTCFLSTAHSDRDLEAVIRAVQKSCLAMRQGDFFPSTESAPLREAPAVREIPITAGQKEIWVLSQLGTEVSRAYNEATRLHLRGALDVEGLRRAIRGLVDRHQALRATISPDGERLLIHSRCDLELPLVDLPAPGEEGGASLEAWVDEQAKAPFDLVRGPLVRAAIARLSAAEHVLVITIHHAVVDGVSFGVLLSELGRLYALEVSIPGVRPLDPAPQFEDYVRLLNEASGERDPQVEEDEAYWLGQFADGLPLVELPAVGPRRPLQAFAVARYRTAFGADLYHALQELSARQGTTLFVTLLAAFEVLLSRITGQRDLLVGISAAGQVAVGQRNVVGYCVNPLPLRTRIDDGETFSRLLHGVKRSVLDGFEHQRCPIGRLIKKLGVRRTSGRALLAPAVFNLDRTTPPRFADLDVEISTQPTGAKVEVYWSLIETGTDLALECDYSRDLFMPEQVASWAADFAGILREITTGDPVVTAIPRFAPAGAVSTEGLGLTQNQRLFWAGQQLHPDLPLFNMGTTFEIRSAIDPDLFRRAAQAVFAASDALRTVFSEVAGEPRQRVLPAAPFATELVDLSRRQDPRAEAEGWLEKRCRIPLDLSGLLVDPVLLKLGEEEYVWYLNIHHILADAWSHALVFGEIAACYARLLAGEQEPRADLPPFRDYVVQESALRRSPEFAEAVAYWKEKLASPAPELRFYGGRRSQDMQAVRIGLDLGRERSARLRELALSCQPGTKSDDWKLFDLFAGLLAAYLFQVTGERRISIGVPFHNRRTEVVKRTVGLFMHILPVRVEITDQDTVLSLARKFGGEVGQAMRHRGVAVENRLREPAYEVLLNFHKLQPPPFLGRPTRFRWLLPGVAAESLALQVWQWDEGIALEMDLRLDLFPQPQRGRVLTHFLGVVDSFLAGNELPVGSLVLLSDEERAMVIEGFNRSRRDYPVARSLAELLEEQVARTPERTALSSPAGALTYAELNRRVNRMVPHLVAAGAGPEVVVSILAERSTDFWLAALAVLKAGAAYLPLDPSHPEERLGQVLRQSRSPLVLVSDAFSGRLHAALTSVPGGDGPRTLGLEELSARRGSDDNPHRSARPNGLAYVIYTSGSTGKPKGVMIEQQGMINHLYAKIEGFTMTGSDIVAQTASQCFDISVWQLLSALLVGGRVFVVPDEETQDAARLLHTLAAQGITVVETVPSMLRALLQAAETSSRPDLRALRWMICNGEALPPELCHRWSALYPAIPMANIYGATETSDDVTHHLLAGPPEAGEIYVPVGTALPNVRVYVLDRELQPVPVGVAGEVCAGGVCVGRGYLHDPWRTAEVFRPDLFGTEPGARLYRLGDLGRFHEDGALELLGRIDHQVKVRGFRIEIGEVELVLGAHPALREVAVIAREDRPGETYLAAYLVPAGEPAPTVTELHRFLRERLPEYMVPSAFVVMAALPLNANGKVDRRALPAPGPDRPDLAAGYVAPRTPEERILAGIWGQVLGLDRIGVHDNFFELGGDSILSLQVASRAAQAGVRFNPIDIFAKPTVADLALATTPVVPPPVVEPAATGEVPLTPIVSWWLEQRPQNPRHFNQAVLLEVDRMPDPAVLEAALRALERRHDALRLRLVPTGEGWRQRVSDSDGEPLPLLRMDLSALPVERRREALESAAQELQRDLDLTRGPLWRMAAVDFASGSPGRFLWVIHHTAVDGVSWRILVEDLHDACRQLAAGGAPRLPWSTPFKEWAESSRTWAASTEAAAEAAYWLAATPAAPIPLPVDLPGGENTVASTRTVNRVLTPEQTHALLTEVPARLKVQINEILLAALATAVAGWSGNRSVLVLLEGHGREPMGEGMDLSRTVGWFTSLFPVPIVVAANADLGATLAGVQETLKTLPRRGIGYGALRYLSPDGIVRKRMRALPEPEISFNYLGRIDQGMSSSASWRLAREGTGDAVDASAPRPVLLEINSQVAGGRFQVQCAYSRNCHRAETVERLCDGLVRALVSLLEQGSRGGREEVVPVGRTVDFNWSADDLEDITAALGGGTA